MAPAPAVDWGAAWEGAEEGGEVVDDYELGPRESLQDAVEAVAGIVGMAALAGSDAVPPNARSHAVLLSGVLADGRPALARVAFGVAADGGVAMQVAARGPGAAAVPQIIAEA